MRWKPHVRFGGRARETYRPRGRHRALVRSRLANSKLDECRRRVQTLGHRDHKQDPLYRSRRLLTRADERLQHHGRTKLLGLLAARRPPRRGARRLARQEVIRSIYKHHDPELELTPDGLRPPSTRPTTRPTREDDPTSTATTERCPTAYVTTRPCHAPW